MYYVLLQSDNDADGVGNPCDRRRDRDSDGIKDSADNCQSVINSDQLNHDSDSNGDACDDDDDDDGVLDTEDNCPLVANDDQLDTDGERERERERERELCVCVCDREWDCCVCDKERERGSVESSFEQPCWLMALLGNKWTYAENLISSYSIIQLALLGNKNLIA